MMEAWRESRKGEIMKTTLTIDADVADVLKERASVQEKSFEQVVNEALRRDVLNGSVGEKQRPVYRVKPNHSGFAPGVDPMRLNQLNDELMVEEFLEKEKKIRDRNE